MSVYVDPVFTWPGKGDWCHMTADTPEELHHMADRIGLKRAWFQDRPTGPHYDLRPSKRILAVEAGAVEVSAAEFLSLGWNPVRPK